MRAAPLAVVCASGKLAEGCPAPGWDGGSTCQKRRIRSYSFLSGTRRRDWLEVVGTAPTVVEKDWPHPVPSLESGQAVPLPPLDNQCFIPERRTSKQVFPAHSFQDHSLFSHTHCLATDSYSLEKLTHHWLLGERPTPGASATHGRCLGPIQVLLR